MEIKRRSDGKVFKVFGATREVQQMPSRSWSEIVTWLLIYDSSWTWILGSDCHPFDSQLPGGIDTNVW